MTLGGQDSMHSPQPLHSSTFTRSMPRSCFSAAFILFLRPADFGAVPVAPNLPPSPYDGATWRRGTAVTVITPEANGGDSRTPCPRWWEEGVKTIHWHFCCSHSFDATEGHGMHAKGRIRDVAAGSAMLFFIFAGAGAAMGSAQETAEGKAVASHAGDSYRLETP